MTTLNIGGKKIKVDDAFDDLDPVGQQRVIRRIERDLGVSSKEPAKADKGTSLKDMARFALGQGTALGFGDEIEGAATALFTDESYSDATDRIRREMDEYRKNNAGKALAMELGGGLLTGGVGAGRVAAAKAAQGLGSAIKAGAATGAGFGGVAGFGSGRDTLENRLTNAAIGTAAGGVLGAGLPAAGNLVKGGVNRLRAATDTLSKSGVDRAADLKILQKMDAEGITPMQTAARLKQAQRDGVTDTMIADIGGESTRGLAQGATAVSGRARTLAEDALDTRQAKSGFEIADDVMGNLASGKSATQATEDIIERQSRNAVEDYNKAFYHTLNQTGKGGNTPDFNLPRKVTIQFDDMVGSAGFKSAYKQAQKLASYDDIPMPSLEKMTERMREGLTPDITFQQAHYLKMGMDAAIDVGKRKGSLSNVEKGKLTNLRQDFKERLFADNPDYARANSRFAGDAAMRDAIDVGRKIFSGTADDLKPLVRDMSESEREAFRIGVSQAIRDRVSNQRDLANSAQDLFGKDRFRSVLREAFPDAKTFAQFQSRMENRINQEVTRSRTKPSAGSRTTPMAEDARDITRDAELFTNLLSGNLSGVGRDVVTRGGGLGSKIGSRVAGDLFDTNLGSQRELLRRLSQLRKSEGKRLDQSKLRAAKIGRGAGTVSGLLTD